MIGKFEVIKVERNEYNGKFYQQMTLLEKSSHMLQNFPTFSPPEASAPVPTSELKGSVITVAIDKIEWFSNGPRFKGSYELAEGTNVKKPASK